MAKKNNVGIIVGVTLIAAGALAYFGFRKGGWFRKKGQGQGQNELNTAVSKAYENLTFAIGKDTILPSSFISLNELAMAMKDSPELLLRLEGHTDNTGSESFNQQLSKKRADAVKSYLVNQSISGDRITTEGFGSSKPIADNNTSDGRAKNRRVEFIIQNSKA